MEWPRDRHSVLRGWERARVSGGATVRSRKALDNYLAHGGLSDFQSASIPLTWWVGAEGQKCVHLPTSAVWRGRGKCPSQEQMPKELMNSGFRCLWSSNLVCWGGFSGMGWRPGEPWEGLGTRPKLNQRPNNGSMKGVLREGKGLRSVRTASWRDRLSEGKVCLQSDQGCGPGGFIQYWAPLRSTLASLTYVTLPVFMRGWVFTWGGAGTSLVWYKGRGCFKGTSVQIFQPHRFSFLTVIRVTSTVGMFSPIPPFLQMKSLPTLCLTRENCPGKEKSKQWKMQHKQWKILVSIKRMTPVVG